MVLALAVLAFQTMGAGQPVNAPATNTPVAKAAPADVSANSNPPAGPAVKSLPAPSDTSSSDIHLDTLKLDSNNSRIAPSYIMNTSASADGQNSTSFSTIRIPDGKPPRQIGVVSAEGYPSRRAWLALTFAQHGAASFDAYSTRRAVSNGGVEADPMMRPFANSPAIYGAIQAGPVLLDLVARRMQRSESPFIRRMWWLPQTMSTGAFLFSGIHNLGVARRTQ